MQRMPIVLASNVLTHAEVQAALPAFQTQIDDHFLPAWGSFATEVKLVFMTMAQFRVQGRPTDWPIFLNKHSNDPGALGWHTDDSNLIYGRCFVGDCLRFGVSWTVDATHEILETLGDPNAAKTWKMPDGRFAAYEACDAVEADDLGYKIGDTLVTDFVLPAYFGSAGASQYDMCGHLKGPCPTLTPGGYMSIFDPHKGTWSQIQEMKADGLASRKALMQGFRRQLRSRSVPI